jgi:hypothetical protein
VSKLSADPCKDFPNLIRDETNLIRDETLVPAWAHDGVSFGFLSGPADQRIAWRVDLSSGAKTPLLDVVKARKSIAAATGVAPPGMVFRSSSLPFLDRPRFRLPWVKTGFPWIFQAMKPQRSRRAVLLTLTRPPRLKPG